ncbi:C-terminal-binding protein 2 [Aphelenchoides bicaudatus]|nr:C-terminal-binding protein 2 [Aphelenchoides bicaudatus]
MIGCGSSRCGDPTGRTTHTHQERYMPLSGSLEAVPAPKKQKATWPHQKLVFEHNAYNIGHEDTRHFYRIPKRPLILRQRWLKAIGRTEETVVSQLRICSAHFKDGEKKEDKDIPVPDPEASFFTLDAPLSIALPPKESKTTEKRRTKPSQFDNLLRFPSNGSTVDNFSSRGRLNSMFMGNASMAAAFVNAFKCVAKNQQLMPKSSPLFLQTNNQIAKTLEPPPENSLFERTI